MKTQLESTHCTDRFNFHSELLPPQGSSHPSTQHLLTRSLPIRPNYDWAEITTTTSTANEIAVGLQSNMKFRGYLFSEPRMS